MLALKERYFSGAVPRFSTPNSTDLTHTVTLDYQGVCAIHNEHSGVVALVLPEKSHGAGRGT